MLGAQMYREGREGGRGGKEGGGERGAGTAGAPVGLDLCPGQLCWQRDHFRGTSRNGLRFF